MSVPPTHTYANDRTVTYKRSPNFSMTMKELSHIIMPLSKQNKYACSFSIAALIYLEILSEKYI
jgi:hypothetical protein